MTDTSRDIPISELAGSGPASRHGRFRGGRCSAARVSLALPWLEAMASAAPGAARPPKRLVSTSTSPTA